MSKATAPIAPIESLLAEALAFTRHLEMAYVRMVERKRNGEGPKGFAAEALDAAHG